MIKKRHKFTNNNLKNRIQNIIVIDNITIRNLELPKMNYLHTNLISKNDTL